MLNDVTKIKISTRRTYPVGGIRGWLLQRITAVIIFGIVLIHLIIIHYSTPGEPVTFQESFLRLQNPYFILMWLVLLAVGLYHVLYGLRNIILDFIKVKNMSSLNGILLALGIVVFALGVFFLVPLIIGKTLFGG